MTSTTKIYMVTNRTRTEWRGTTPKVEVDLQSMNSWNCCGICNHPARCPVCCPHGDVFCKECILEFLLSNSSSSKTKSSENSDHSSTKKKKSKVLCPICSNKISFKSLLDLEYAEDQSSSVPNGNAKDPLCCGCDKPMVGIIKAYRVPCSHVVCQDCYNQIIKVDMQCPKCTKKFTNQKEVILLNKSMIDQVNAGGKIVVKGRGVFMQFG